MDVASGLIATARARPSGTHGSTNEDPSDVPVSRETFRLRTLLMRSSSGRF